jgi:hypothetical protein
MSWAFRLGYYDFNLIRAWRISYSDISSYRRVEEDESTTTTRHYVDYPVQAWWLTHSFLTRTPSGVSGLNLHIPRLGVPLCDPPDVEHRDCVTVTDMRSKFVPKTLFPAGQIKLTLTKSPSRQEEVTEQLRNVNNNHSSR